MLEIIVLLFIFLKTYKTPVKTSFYKLKNISKVVFDRQTIDDFVLLIIYNNNNKSIKAFR